MMSRFAFSLSIAALAVFPALSHAGETQWETLRLYTLADGTKVAVGVPAEWQELGEGPAIGTRTSLRFKDETGTQVELPVAALLRASAGKRVVRADDSRKIAFKLPQKATAPSK
jgi:spermidine/putrescine-binding protein